MTLTLTIANVAALPDGGPLSVSLSGRRGLDIGRDQYLDWSLPDPDRVISGKHAEIRYRDGGYWLTDVSRNGTFLNRNPQRLQEPSRLRDGDQIEIGHYVIAVHIDGEGAPAQSPAVGATPISAKPENYWEPAGEAAPPLPGRDFRPPLALRPAVPDFVDWAVDVPDEALVRPKPAARDVERDMEWARASPEPPPPPRPEMPMPRRAGHQAASGSEPADLAALQPRAAAGPGAARGPQADPWKEHDAPVAVPRPAVPPVALAMPQEPAPASERPQRSAEAADAFVRRFAAGLGVAPEVLSWQDPGEAAEKAGLLLRLCAANLQQLLTARAESKRTARAANQTTIQALDNNPLKFAPTVDDALRIMLGRPSSSYLAAPQALESGFRDLKTHQIKTYAAMQSALRLLLDDLSPEGIAASSEEDRGLAGLLGSRKARLWDIYVARWTALAAPYDDGMIDAFMVFFSDCYDKNR